MNWRVLAADPVVYRVTPLSIQSWKIEGVGEWFDMEFENGKRNRSFGKPFIGGLHPISITFSMRLLTTLNTLFV